jgi:hypothetical protein
MLLQQSVKDRIMRFWRCSIHIFQLLFGKIFILLFRRQKNYIFHHNIKSFLVAELVLANKIVVNFKSLKPKITVRLLRIYFVYRNRIKRFILIRISVSNLKIGCEWQTNDLFFPIIIPGQKKTCCLFNTMTKFQ